MYIATLQQFDYSGQKSKKQFAVYDSDTPVTLKQGQDHQTQYDLVDPKQGYNNAKSETPRLNSVCKKANYFFPLIKSGNSMSISSLNMWDIHGLLDVLDNLTKCQINQIRSYNFQLKLFDTAMALNFGQGH